MTEARLFTNVRTASVDRGVGRPVRIEIDALWVEAGWDRRAIGFALKRGRVDTVRPVFAIELECDPLEHEFALSEPPKLRLARADLAFKDSTRSDCR